MNESDRQNYLKLALRIVAAIFVFGFYPLTVLWPSGWSWNPAQSEYLQMIIAIYATLGIFLWLAARDPGANLGLVSFTIWSSIVHGGVMTVQSLANPHHMGHLAGDVPALFLIAAVMGWLSPRALALRLSPNPA